MDAVEALESLELLGADQWGLMTSAQAQANGISKVWLQRLNARGVLQRLRHGVYALPSSQPGPLRDVQGAWLSVSTTTLEPESEEAAWPAVVSGASAAALHEIGDLLPPYIEFSVPLRRISKQSDVKLVRRTLTAEDVVVMDGLPVTTVERTIHDLSVAPTDLDHLTTLVVDAARLPGTSATSLAQALERRAQKEGRTSGQELLEEMLATQGLDLSSVGLSASFIKQLNQMIKAFIAPALTENLPKFSPAVTEDWLKAFAPIAENQKRFTPELARALSGNLLDSISLISENQKTLAPGLAQAMSEALKPYLSTVSFPTEPWVNLALERSTKDTDPQGHHHDDDDHDDQEED
ncbi:MAG: hypothetical protein ACTIKH_12760 [Glutamicibacter ardleyensis]|uniref:hypothetical protein n=1 Tax=Glutamicibacter ardleyensis TaxID=225894 RepID=UPI003F9E65EA